MNIQVLLPNPYTTSIIHEELIYGDVFINPEDLGKNLKTTYISNLGEVSLEYCIKTILENNENVTFHTIQYSRKQRRLCFYTDNPVNTSKWQEKETKPPQKINTKEEITKAVLSVFENEPIYDQDCASVYEILMIYQNLDKQIKNVKDKTKNVIQTILNNKVDSDIYCSVHDFDYDTHSIQIHMSTRWSSTWDKYEYFKEPDGTIKEKKLEGYHDYKVLGNVSEHILDLINFYLSIEETRKQRRNKIKSVNSDLFIDIDHYNIDVYIDKYGGYYMGLNPLFKSTFYTYSDKIEHSYAYSDILDKLTNNEMEFLKKIHVKIDDCPSWIREQLYQKRQAEIVERQRQEEELKLKEQTQLVLEEDAPQKKLSIFQQLFTRKKEK